VNVSALVAGQPRIVPFEGRFSVEKLRSAITRGGDDLGVIRSAIAQLIERASPGSSDHDCRAFGSSGLNDKHAPPRLY